VLGMDTDETFSSVGLSPLNGFIKCIINYPVFFIAADIPAI